MDPLAPSRKSRRTGLSSSGGRGLGGPPSTSRARGAEVQRSGSSGDIPEVESILLSAEVGAPSPRDVLAPGRGTKRLRGLVPVCSSSSSSASSNTSIASTLAWPPAPPLVKVGEAMRRGAFGTVHVADDGSDRPLAIKKLRLGHGETFSHARGDPGGTLPTRRDDFVREARMLRADYVDVKLHSVLTKCSKTRGHPIRGYLIMDLMAGSVFDLGEWLDEHLQSLPVRPSHWRSLAIDGPSPALYSDLVRLLCGLRIVIEVARQLDKLHANHVVFRDLKGDNVMISLGATPKLRLIDFGLVMEGKPPFRDLNPSGSLPFISPERLRGEPYSYATDLWSLGCMVVQMVTRQLPFPILERPRHPSSRRFFPVSQGEASEDLSRQYDEYEAWHGQAYGRRTVLRGRCSPPSSLPFFQLHEKMKQLSPPLADMVWGGLLHPSAKARPLAASLGPRALAIMTEICRNYGDALPAATVDEAMNHFREYRHPEVSKLLNLVRAARPDASARRSSSRPAQRQPSVLALGTMPTRPAARAVLSASAVLTAPTAQASGLPHGGGPPPRWGGSTRGA